MFERTTADAHRALPRKARAFAAGLLASLLVLLTACSSGPPAAEEETTRTVTDGVGEVTIPTNPQRVVAADASTFAQLVSLGIEPVAAALPEGVPTDYFRPDGVDIPNVVAEDGWTVNLEKTLELDADLIVTLSADWNTENIERYKASPIPTYALDEGWKDIEDVYAKFRKFAADLGRAEAAEEAIGAFEQKLADGKKALEPYVADLGTVGIVRTTEEGWVGARVEDVVATALLPGLGIKTPDWPAANADGYFKVDVETLEKLDIVDTFFVETEVNPKKLPVLQSDVWKTLTPVKNDKVIVFVAKWWNGDLLQLGSIADEIVKGVTERGDGG
ncbi:MAG: ABC transporter substrate-binding protein [Microlunatus sp.]